MQSDWVLHNSPVVRINGVSAVRPRATDREVAVRGRETNKGGKRWIRRQMK
jgi:hypothetical protein